MSLDVSDSIKQLEAQMESMSKFLEKMVISDDDGDIDEDEGIDELDCYTDREFTRKTLNNETHLVDAAGGSSGQLYGDCYRTIPPAANDPNNYSKLNCGIMDSSPLHMTNTVTSVLGNGPNLPTTSSDDQRPSTSSLQPRHKIYAHEHETPSICGVDIHGTMRELGLSPELVTRNDVHKLFSLLNDLEFSVHAEYIATGVFDKKAIPYTMSVSAQIKYAIWSCCKLHRNLREVLKRPMPTEYKPAYKKCEEALSVLKWAISELERFKHCTMEHRKGIFVSPDAEECLIPLTNTLNHLTDCVQKSQFYIQAYQRALNASEVYQAANSEELPQPIPEKSYAEVPRTSNREMARRYIG